MANPVTLSDQTNTLLANAGQAAGADKDAASQVAVDNTAINTLSQQLSAANATLSTDQQAATAADATNQASFIALCQSIAKDFDVSLPVTIAVPAA